MGVLDSRANNNLEESIRVLDEAIRRDPNYAEALANRGLIRVTEKNKVGALTDFEAAFRLKPFNKQFSALVISLKMELEQFLEAIEILETLLKRDPQDSKNFYKIALCYQKLSQFEAASITYKKMISIIPTHFEAYTNLGLGLTMNDELDEPINTYGKVQVIKPYDPGTLNNMGIALTKNSMCSIRQ